MTMFKLISILITTIFLFACGSENSQAKNETTGILFESQKKVLDDAKNVEQALADEEQKRKDRMNKLEL